MSEEYWKDKKAADDFEKYWNVQNKASLERRWNIVQSLQLEPPKSLLDVGCGIGNLITFTKLAMEENYIGIDISQPMVERARGVRVHEKRSREGVHPERGEVRRVDGA